MVDIEVVVELLVELILGIEVELVLGNIVDARIVVNFKVVVENIMVDVEVEV